GHQVETGSADIPLVWGDEGLLQELLIQLVDNALTHTPPGTRILLSTSYQQERLQLAVEDDGPGFGDIAPEALFEPFKRGDPRKPGGLGLGLSVARRFAQAVGGDVHAEAALPRGARFIVEIP